MQNAEDATLVKDSDAHRSPLGEASGCCLSREQPADDLTEH